MVRTGSRQPRKRKARDFYFLMIDRLVGSFSLPFPLRIHEEARVKDYVLCPGLLMPGLPGLLGCAWVRLGA